MGPKSNKDERVMKTQKRFENWFYWFQVAFTGTQLFWFVLVLLDFIMNPLAPDAQSGSIFYRLLTTLGFVPLALIVSILVLRRSPGNVVGLFLFQWTVLIMSQSLPAESPLQPYKAISFGWVGLWLIPLYF